mgnify:CR=1 FL=1
MPLPLVVALVVVVLAMVVWQRMRLSQSLAENKDKTLGALAARLGLADEEGDPALNLMFFQQPSGDYQRQLRASGAPYGRKAAFILLDGVATSEYIVYRRITHSFGCFLDVELAREVARFEVVLRAPNEYLLPLQGMADDASLKEAKTGNPQLDGRYVVRTADPALAPLLAPALEVLGQQHFVHLAGQGNRVWSSFTRMGLPYLSYAPEEYLLALETAACALEGKPLPARLTP